MTYLTKLLLFIVALVWGSAAQAQPEEVMSTDAVQLELQPDTCVRLQQQDICQLTLRLKALPQDASSLCIWLKHTVQPSSCQPLSQKPVQELTLLLQQDVLIKIIDQTSRLLAIGEIKVVTFKPVQTTRRKRGLGWNLL